MFLQDKTLLHVFNPTKIKRKHCAVVLSEQERKEYKVLFKKCRLKINLIPALTVTYYLFIYLSIIHSNCTLLFDL
jgi:hypothetical protein